MTTPPIDGTEDEVDTFQDVWGHERRWEPMICWVIRLALVVARSETHPPTIEALLEHQEILDTITMVVWNRCGDRRLIKTR